MSEPLLADVYMPCEAEIVERIQESSTVFTWRLRFTDAEMHRAYSFAPGQFNMVYVHGVGEVPISISSDPSDSEFYDHTIRVVGRVTQAMAKLKTGDRLGIRGPYGRGWPMDQALGKDVLVMTGGLGCAPVAAVIMYVLKRRTQFGKLFILQGVKRAEEMIYHKRYAAWANTPDTTVLLAADQGGVGWPWHTGYVTDLLDKVPLDINNTVAMMCGPEVMMKTSMEYLLDLGVPGEHLFMSMERNMHCAVGHCGHCQLGPKFICKDGPVFSYPEVRSLFDIKGL